MKPYPLDSYDNTSGMSGIRNNDMGFNRCFSSVNHGSCTTATSPSQDIGDHRTKLHWLGTTGHGDGAPCSMSEDKREDGLAWRGDWNWHSLCGCRVWAEHLGNPAAPCPAQPNARRQQPQECSRRAVQFLAGVCWSPHAYRAQSHLGCDLGYPPSY